MDRQTDRLKYTHTTVSFKDRQWIDRQTYGYTNRQRDMYIDTQTNGQTDRQIERHTYYTLYSKF